MNAGKTYRNMIHLLAAACCVLAAVLNINELTAFFSQVTSSRGRLLSIGVTAVFLGILLLMLRTGILKKPKKPAWFGLLLFMASLGLKAGFILLVDTQQFSDYQLLYQATVQIARQNPEYQSWQYFSVWAYQTGFPAMMAGF